jgi:hypothetical protein
MRHDERAREMSACGYIATLANRERLRNRLVAVSPDGDRGDALARGSL